MDEPGPGGGPQLQGKAWCPALSAAHPPGSGVALRQDSQDDHCPHTQCPQGVFAKYRVSRCRKYLACVFEHPLAPTSSPPWCLWEQGRPVFREEQPHPLWVGVGGSHPAVECLVRTLAEDRLQPHPVCAGNHQSSLCPEASVTVLTTCVSLLGPQEGARALEWHRGAALGPEPGEWALVLPSHGGCWWAWGSGHSLSSPGGVTTQGAPTPPAVQEKIALEGPELLPA